MVKLIRHPYTRLVREKSLVLRVTMMSLSASVVTHTMASGKLMVCV